MPGLYTVVYAFDSSCDSLCPPMPFEDAWMKKIQIWEDEAWCPLNWFKVVPVTEVEACD